LQKTKIFLNFIDANVKTNGWWKYDGRKIIVSKYDGWWKYDDESKF
jgi:hypothetical protein